MKFTYIATGLMAALASAQPIVEEDKSSVDFASGAVTGELAPQLVSEVLAERALAKRANVQFTVFKSPDCSGSGTGIGATASGSKGNFSPAQQSIRITQLTNGWHLSLYTGSQQSGVLTRFYAGEVGANKCYTGSWLSYGLFSS